MSRQFKQIRPLRRQFKQIRRIQYSTQGQRRQFKQIRSIQYPTLRQHSGVEWNAVAERDTAELRTLSPGNGTVSKGADLAKQGTMKLSPAGNRSISSFPYTLTNNLPGPIQRLFIAVLERAQDSAPEAYHTRSQNGVGERATTWGRLPRLALTNASGLILIAYALNISRDGGPNVRLFLYPGLLLIFSPVAVRLISPTASRTERVGLVCVVGISFYIIKVMSYPLYFTLFDEFLHWRTADDILTSGHLFTPNSLLPVSDYYPGLEIVTNAFSTLCKLNTFYAGIIVSGVARLLMVLALFLIYEKLSRSDRMASIATLLYMTNPHFLFFDAQFAYESLALPLYTLILLVMISYQSASTRLTYLKSTLSLMLLTKEHHKGLRREIQLMTLAAWIALVAVVLTHHVTVFFFDGLLIVWAAIYCFLFPIRIYRSNLVWTALLAVLLTVAWICFNGNPVVSYVSSFLENSITELGQILVGTGDARQLFAAYNGLQSPVYDRVLAILCVALIMLCLSFGLLCLWLHYRSEALSSTLGIISLLYPVSQIFRFSNAGGQLTDRAAAFLYIPIAFLIAILIGQFWPLRLLNWKNTTLITSAMSIMLLGGLVLGGGTSLSILPGPYQVGADQRSVESEGIQAALWAASHLGSDNRVGTDRTNQVLMGTFGAQSVVTETGDNIDIAPIFFSLSFTPNDLSIIRKAQIHYLVVDMRLSQSTPLIGIYFDQDEPDADQHTSPVAREALTKFNTLPLVNRVFDSGDIVIYDTGGMLNAHEKS